MKKKMSIAYWIIDLHDNATTDLFGHENSVKTSIIEELNYKSVVVESLGMTVHNTHRAIVVSVLKRSLKHQNQI